MGGTDSCCRQQLLDPGLDFTAVEFHRTAADAPQPAFYPEYKSPESKNTRDPPRNAIRLDVDVKNPGFMSARRHSPGAMSLISKERDLANDKLSAQVSFGKANSYANSQGSAHKQYYAESKNMAPDGYIKLENLIESKAEELHDDLPENVSKSKIDLPKGVTPLKSLPDLKDHPSMQILQKLQRLPVPKMLLTKYSSDEYKKLGPVLISNSQIYIGQWRGSEIEGIGLLISSTGRVYQGEFAYGIPEGLGRLITQTGDIYQGEFLAGKAEGQGEFLGSEKLHYSGSWKDDLRHGDGEELWFDGSKYSGEFYKGEKHGEGSLEWINGCRYRGQFLDGQINGLGKVA
jgi:hypothetical protein